MLGSHIDPKEGTYENQFQNLIGMLGSFCVSLDMQRDS